MFLLIYTVPSPVVEVFSVDSVEYGQTATLECNVTAARGITSRVDIIWSNGIIVKTVENVTANIVNNSAVYSDQLITPPLSVNDSGRVYYCKVDIKATFEITSFNRFTLDFVGTLVIHIYVYVRIITCKYACILHRCIYAHMVLLNYNFIFVCFDIHGTR